MKFSKMMKATALSVSLFAASVANVFAATPPPSPNPVVYTNGTSNDTESYIAGNAATQSVYNQLLALVYATFNDVLDSFEAFFQKVVATVPGFSGYQVVRSNTQTPSGSTRGQVEFYDDSNPEKLLVEINAQSSGANGTGTWRPFEKVTGPYVLPVTPPVPIDGGASLLLAAGAAYGLKRLRRRKGENPESEK